MIINSKEEFESSYPYDKRYIKEYPREYPCILKIEEEGGGLIGEYKQVYITYFPKNVTSEEGNEILLSLSGIIDCVHPFNEVVSGDKGDFCCKCQNYLNSYRL